MLFLSRPLACITRVISLWFLDTTVVTEMYRRGRVGNAKGGLGLWEGNWFPSKQWIGFKSVIAAGASSSLGIELSVGSRWV